MQETQVEMTIFEAILARRCVRNYTEQVVDLGAIHILLEAAIHGPTALHEEPWTFAIIRDKELLKDISDYAKPLFAGELQIAGRAPGSLNLVPLLSLISIFSTKYTRYQG